MYVHLVLAGCLGGLSLSRNSVSRLTDWLTVTIIVLIGLCVQPQIKPTQLLTEIQILLAQGGHWSGKSQGNLNFLQGQGKMREFCKLAREILNTKKVREKSGNFIILAQKYVL